jgi:hypothetical protein
MKFEILLFVCTFGVFGKKEDKENETSRLLLRENRSTRSFKSLIILSHVNARWIRPSIPILERSTSIILRAVHILSTVFSLLLDNNLSQSLDELKKKYPEPEIHMKKAYTSLYNKTENKYYCQVRGGYCIDIAIWQPDDPEKMNKDTGYPCHERSCASKVNNIKGCVEHEIAKEAGNSCKYKTQIRIFANFFQRSIRRR